MNQILSTGMPNNGKNKKNKNKTKNNYQGPADVRSVTKFFVVILMFFGIFMIGTASYGLYRNSNEGVISAIPTITVEEQDESTLLLTVIGENDISQIVYYWNDGEQNTINGNNRKYIEQEISIPSGSNILNIEVTDINGGRNTYSEQYELDSNIEIEASSTGNITINYEGDTQIA